jgi:hypothetical protein
MFKGGVAGARPVVVDARLAPVRGILVAPEDPQVLAAALEGVLHDELPRCCGVE